MAVHFPNISELSPHERASAIERAGAAVAEGGLAIAACESGYLLVGAGDSIAGQAGLARLKDPTGTLRPAWLAGNVATVERALGEALPLGKRLLRRLAPGPAVFRFELPEGVMDVARRQLKVGPEAVDFDGALWARVPDDSPASALAGRRGAALACIDVVGSDGRVCVEAEAAAQAVRAAGLEPAALLGMGSVSVKAGATAISVGPSGVRVLRAGAFEERFVRKMARMSILFVCTGNTCRSPMAEAIANALLAQRGAAGESVQVGSAGVAAGSGAPASVETAAAVRALGMTMGRHASRPLTRNLIDDADAVFAMTESHAAAVRAMHPAAASKVRLLDPGGGDVPDPIGMGQETYNQTARRLKELIERRLGEITL